MTISKKSISKKEITEGNNGGGEVRVFVGNVKGRVSKKKLLRYDNNSFYFKI